MKYFYFQFFLHDHIFYNTHREEYIVCVQALSISVGAPIESKFEFLALLSGSNLNQNYQT